MSSPVGGRDFLYQSILAELRTTLGHLDQLASESAAALHIQWAIDLIEQDHPHLKIDVEPDLE